MIVSNPVIARSILIGILSVIVVLCVFIIVGAHLGESNPIYVPDPTPPPFDVPDGGLTPVESPHVRFVSENITVRLETQYAFIDAEYTFSNNGNTSLNDSIFLPFSNLNPYINDLVIIGKNESIPFTWSRYDLSFTEDTLYHTYKGAIFSLSFDPGEFISIRATYYRPYLNNEYYNYADTDYGQFLMEHPFDNFDSALGMIPGYYSMYVYLSRTGSLWDHPIEYAKFTFFVNESLCTGSFFPGYSFYNEYFSAHEPHYKNEQILNGLAHSTDFLWAEPVREGDYYRLSRTYTNWTPETDIGIAWINQPPNPRIDYEFDNSTGPGCFHFSAGRSEDNDGTIVNYTWEFGEGVKAYGTNVNHTFSERGSYTIVLWGEDDMGYRKSAVQTFDIWSTADMFLFYGDDYFTFLEDDCAYNGTDMNIFWRFGDGNGAIGRNVTNRYTEAGDFRVIVELYRTWGTGWGSSFAYDRYIIMDFDSDGDGHRDSIDGFPHDPAASRDTDKDGYPDHWNQGMSRNDSTMNLQLDEYPDDPQRWGAGSGGMEAEPVVLPLMLVAFVNVVLLMYLAWKWDSRRYWR